VRWAPPRPDVTPLLHAADVVALPAQWDEPFGRVLIEAMASGRPAVATRTGGVPEVLTGDFERFLVDRKDVGALAKALDGALDWRLTEPALGPACRAHVIENFTLGRVLDEVEKILADAARTHRTGLRGPALGTGGAR
jgi:glycosyltransferase involved in cell wall biosynthesis